MLVLAALICLIKVLDCRSINDSLDSAKAVFDLQTDSHTLANRLPPCNPNKSQATSSPNDDEAVVYIKKSRTVDDRSDFCLLDKRGYRGRIGNHLKCELKAPISNVFRPIKVYNISLMLFFDTFFEKQSHNVTRDLRYLIRGLQENYISYDMINEIGRIKFYVLQIWRMNLSFPDAIDTKDLKSTFIKYVRDAGIFVPSTAISVWFTRANLIAYETDLNGEAVSKDIKGIKRIEGVAYSDRFCNGSPPIVLVNCNSLNKAVNTLGHEIGRRTHSITHQKVLETLTNSSQSSSFI